MSNNWGGARAGAGRPSMGDTKRRITDLPIEIDNFVVKSSSASKKTVSAWIRDLIQSEREKQMRTLVWNENRQVYTSELADGRLLVVGGDDFAEARHERALAYLKEAHPEMSAEDLDDLLCNTEEGNNADTKAFNELVDIDEWEPFAQDVDEEGFTLAGASAWFE